ncbi:hypothetical protein [Marinobacter bohaiensis]|uniref:hypothetical protein n=1 Tax=Marinobacter bohaiensis TaxID=2201898 RepID=UPI000DAED51B|nr:hypothetical protein [Marinobacter bohaiensis]
MTPQQRLAAAMAAVMTAPAWAGVESMTSQEMVDTYIEDSAIIVVPRARQKAEAERQRIIRSLTISPGEPVIEESEEQAYAYILRRGQYDRQSDNLRQAESEALRQFLLLPIEEAERTQPVAHFTPVIPPVIYGRQVEIPDEPFNQTFLNDQLSIGFDGENVNFSIGNPPGIDQIQVPYAIDEGPVQLTPRPGGGFDLSIAVPDPQ